MAFCPHLVYTMYCTIAQPEVAYSMFTYILYGFIAVSNGFYAQKAPDDTEAVYVYF